MRGPDSPTAWVVAVAVVLVAIGLLLLGRRLRARRMAAYAADSGRGFSASEPSLLDRFTGPPFDQGRSREALDVVHATVQGHPVVCFEYSWDDVGALAQAVDAGPHDRGVVAVVLGPDADRLAPRLVGRPLLDGGEPGRLDGDAVVFVHPHRLLPEEVDTALTRLAPLLDETVEETP